MRIRRSKLDTTNPQSEIHNPQFEREAYGTKMLPDPLFPSLDAVTSANPAPTARTSTVWPKAPSIRATEESLTVHDTARPERMFPLASRRSAKNPALSPTTTVADSGETVTDATGPGLRPGIESPEESTAAKSPSGRPAPSCSLQAATASAVAASAAVRTPFMRFLRECCPDWIPRVAGAASHQSATSSPSLAVRPSIYTPHSALHIPHCYDRPSHRVVAVGRRANRGPARAARSEDRARPGERGGGGGRDPHAAAAGGAARPLSRPARRVGAAARGDAAHRRELALGARPHGGCRGGDPGQLGRGGDLGAAPGRSDGHLGRRPCHVSADRGGGAAAHPGRRQGAHPLQRGCARDRRDRNRARASL